MYVIRSRGPHKAYPEETLFSTGMLLNGLLCNCQLCVK